MRYALGIVAGVLSGLVFSSASIAQKRAIDAIGAEAPLFRNLARKPLWLAGFAASFLLGAPLNMASYVAIGPTLPPALGSMGLALVPFLARVFLGERPSARAYAGAVAIALAIACIGLSGAAIAPESVDWAERGFFLRAAIAAGCILAALAAFAVLGMRPRGSGSAWFALSAGASQALANALMSPIAGQLGRLVSGRLDAPGLMVIAAASLALAAVNGGAMAMAQLALRKGAAATVIPLQQLPIQAIPLILHAWLYRGGFGSAAGTALLGSGIFLLVAGSFALGSSGRLRQPYQGLVPGWTTPVPHPSRARRP